MVHTAVPGRLRRLRTSLYARAALFLLMGSASLLGAMAVLAHTTVQESVSRILDERVALARAVGVLLENRIGADMTRMADTVAAAFLADPEDEVEAVRAALVHEYRTTAFREGAFFLDADGDWVTAVPSSVARVRQLTDLSSLAAEAAASRRMSASRLLGLQNSHAPILVVLREVRSLDDRLLGFVGGALAPGGTNVLDPLVREQEGHLAVDVVDRAGVVVASTEREALFSTGDHMDTLTSAIARRDELRSECHSCHEVQGASLPEPEVMAFAPLPELDMGVAVHQPRDEALAPAFALQRRLYLLGTGFVGLFLMFAGLSVRSVVHPVTRLTDAVHRLEGRHGRLRLPRFGRDEVGELATALDTWRGRMVDSLETAEAHREALHREIEGTRRHLAALERVAAEAMGERSPGEVLERGLQELLTLLGLPRGAMRVNDAGRSYLAARGMGNRDAVALLDRVEGLPPHTMHPHMDGFGRCQHGRVPPDPDETGAPVLRVAAHHEIPEHFAITSVLEDDRDRPDLEERRLQSMNHHIAIAVMSRILHEREMERQALQAQLLHRVLSAQESERRRVARDLHDTVAQDLAALRLEIERLSGRARTDEMRGNLEVLEERASDTLAAVRRTLLDLRLSVLENMGFLPTLQWHLERVEREHGVRGILTIDGEEKELPYEIAVILFRIFQESLQNVVQHAGAEHVSVTVGFTDTHVELVVEDDGHGFDAAGLRDHAPTEGGRGLGMLGMEERARLLGGLTRVESRPGEGTTVTVRVPLRPVSSAVFHSEVV